ncbi:MAG: penicillin acylase family protein [Saprospiraceae bacterium]
MKTIKLLIPLFLSCSWCYFLNHQIALKDGSLPPLGKFFSPFKGFWQNTKEALPKINESIHQDSIEGNVYFDERAVPHIQASTLENAYFIQGYVHALHRLWQMDFSSRAAEGRISEIIGEKAIDFDKNKRRRGLAESARKSIEIWKKFPEVYSLLQAYSNGVNYYIDHLEYKDYPIEYKLMNFEPEHWSPYKSSLFHKSMAEILCGRDQDVELQNALSFFGNDFNLLFPEWDSQIDPVIPAGTNWGFKLDSMNHEIIPDKKMDIIPIEMDSSASGLGSNNWAIASSKSKSKNPILCNDPHLSLNLPSIWYEQQIITPEFNVYGVSFAGIPGVVIGFNKDIAWGITNAAWDVQDWYKITWTDDNKTSYLMDGKNEKTDYRIEKILVRGKNAVYDTIQLTRWGPIVYNNPHNSRVGLAMHWIIQDSFNVNELQTFVGLNKSKNYTEYQKYIQNFSYPAQNIAYADRSGNIALTVQGALPIKNNQQGRFVLDGSISKNVWHGFLPYEFNPHTLNPARGYISSANQVSTSPDFPIYYNNGDFRDYRGAMINKLLNKQDQWSVDDLKNLQANNHSLIAETAIPILLSNIDSTKLSDKKMNIYRSMKNWNYDYDSNSIDAITFEIWITNLNKLIWDEITMDSLVKYTALPSDKTTINLIKNYPNLKYYDLKSTEAIEDLAKIIDISLDSTIVQLDLNRNKNWAEYKGTHIDHMAKIQAFGIPYISTSGSKDIINACWKTWGPSWRMVVELTKSGPKAWGVYPGGQDGRPGTQHYMDMIETWRKSEYYDLKYCTSIEELKNISQTTIQFSHK